MLIEPRGEQKDGVESADAKRPRLRCCTHAGFRPRGRRLGCGFGCLCRRMTGKGGGKHRGEAKPVVLLERHGCTEVGAQTAVGVAVDLRPGWTILEHLREPDPRPPETQQGAASRERRHVDRQ